MPPHQFQKLIEPITKRSGPVPAVLRWVGRLHRRFNTWRASLGDRELIEQEGIDMLAPARLRDRVHGQPDARSFLSGGRRSFEAIRKSVEQTGQRFEVCGPVLDFGCGCSRTLRWFQWYKRLELYGTDIDAEAIEWCRKNVPIATFNVNGALPPLDYEDDTFGLIYGISVLTHLDEEYQDAWLKELSRITRPGGLVLLSVHGEGSWSMLTDAERATVREKGFIFTKTNRWTGVFPSWYQNAFHSSAYVRERFARTFEVLAIHEGILGEVQDLVVMRKA